MLTVCLCGSTRFKRIFELCIKELTSRGITVLYPDYYDNFDNNRIFTEDEIKNLEKIHFNKIKLYDTILIINPFDYIGEATKKEISYATELGKQILYFNDDKIFENYMIDSINRLFNNTTKCD